jgi:hypothetical protein
MRAFHDYVGQFPRVRECLPLPRQYHNVADQRTQRKRTSTKYIVDRVKTMKEDLMSASIPVEQGDVEESEWVTYMQDFRLKYYN